MYKWEKMERELVELSARLNQVGAHFVAAGGDAASPPLREVASKSKNNTIGAASGDSSQNASLHSWGAQPLSTITSSSDTFEWSPLVDNM